MKKVLLVVLGAILIYCILSLAGDDEDDEREKR